jgi:hypothetical protein
MAFFDIDEYGLGRPRNLFDYATILGEEEEEKRRSNKPMIPYTGADLSQYSPTQFDVPDIASALSSTAPTGINPAAPAESQPPAIDVPVTVQDKYERMEGVTNSDRLAALGMSMSAIGTTDFNRIYGASNAALIKKQREADEYNMDLERGTKQTTEVSGNNIITYAPLYTRNSDGTYSVHPKAGQMIESKRNGINGSSGQAYNTYLLMKDNEDIPPETTWDEFQESSAFDPFRTDYQSKVKNTNAYLRSIGEDNPELASQMAAGALQIEDLQGGGIRVLDLAGNEVKVITTAQEAQGFKQAYENAGAYGSKSGEAAVTDLQGFEQDFEEIADGFSETQSSIARGREAMNMLAGQEVDSGFVQGVIAKTFGIGDRQMGKLQGLSGQELINALSQTTLVPVSDTDIKKLELMFANISQDPEFAMGILESFLAERERSLVLSRDKFRRRIERLNENPNIRSPQRESDSFKKTYGNIYNFKTAVELLEEEGI